MVDGGIVLTEYGGEIGRDRPPSADAGTLSPRYSTHSTVHINQINTPCFQTFNEYPDNYHKTNFSLSVHFYSCIQASALHPRN